MPPQDKHKRPSNSNLEKLPNLEFGILIQVLTLSQLNTSLKCVIGILVTFCSLCFSPIINRLWQVFVFFLNLPMNLCWDVRWAGLGRWTSGWISLHPGEDYWEEAERILRWLRGKHLSHQVLGWSSCLKFHLFYQVLGWSSCSGSPTNIFLNHGCAHHDDSGSRRSPEK